VFAGEQFFEFSLTETQLVAISTCDSNFDTILYLMDRDGRVIYFNDDRGDGDCNSLTSVLNVALPAVSKLGLASQSINQSINQSMLL
jgi:hypothetical protein